MIANFGISRDFSVDNLTISESLVVPPDSVVIENEEKGSLLMMGNSLAYFDGEVWNVADSETTQLPGIVITSFSPLTSSLIVRNVVSPTDTLTGCTITKIFDVVNLTIPQFEFTVDNPFVVGDLLLVAVGGIPENTRPNFAKSYAIPVFNGVNSVNGCFLNVFPNGSVGLYTQNNLFPSAFRLAGDITVTWVL